MNGLLVEPRETRYLRSLSLQVFAGGFSLRCGAGGRTRTDMSLTSPDFESGAYTNFATPARAREDNKASYSQSQPDAGVFVVRT